MNHPIMADAIAWIPTLALKPHPENPRVVMRDDVVDAIAANLAEGFDPAHAVLVRPVGDDFQIISGHHRHAAAVKAGVDVMPCWVRDMDDEAAYMALATSNSQGELSPLERGLHALAADGGHGDTKRYAELLGRPRSSIQKEKQAAKVAKSSTLNFVKLMDKTWQLSEIHALPEETWPLVVDRMLMAGWSAKETADQVKTLREFDAQEFGGFYPTVEMYTRRFEYGDFAPQTLSKLVAQCRLIENVIEVNASDEARGDMAHAFREWLAEEPRWSLADLRNYERRLDADFKRAAILRNHFKHGDWREHVADLTDGSVALLLTDPPYGMDYQSNRRADKHDKIANDGSAEAASELGDMLAAIESKLADSAHLLIFVDWRNEPKLRNVIEAAGYTLRGSLIWKKNLHGSGDLQGAFAPMHERILHAVKGGPMMVERVPDVFDVAKADTSRHPTEKPTDLLRKLIEATTVEGELVADPFAGVASTLAAAKQCNRAFWGCEVNDEYHAAGVARL